MADEVPIISLDAITNARPGADDRVARDLLPCLERWGVFQVVDHGVSPTVIEGAFAAAKRFFERPLEERLAIRVDRNNRGYMPMHQTHYPGNKPDLKESFNLGTDLSRDDPDVLAGKPLHGVNRWPELDRFRQPVEAYFNDVLALGDRFLGPLAVCLGMSPESLRELYRKPVAFMRLFHYPPNGNAEDREFGAAEHQDYGFLTFLAQDAMGGLEVRAPNGELAPVPPRTDAFVVNVADMLSAITGGRFRSPYHRVVNRSGRARYSIPFFFDPNFDARFASMPDVSAGEFLLNKFNQFYKYRKQLAGTA
ncbi:MAG TPA: 2-oxoglutarate and iron-dependent oxygenase domain-containing protein [Alphaproteobacteria bacterium]